MGHPIVDQLRRTVNAKHVEALRAIDLLAGYLNESPPTNVQKSPTKLHAPRAGTGKIRNSVLAAFQREYLSAQAVADETGLTTLQVRGVLSAPSLKDKFSKKEVDGVVCYKYTGETTK